MPRQIAATKIQSVNAAVPATKNDATAMNRRWSVDSTAGDKFEVTATGIFLKSASIVGSQVGDPQDFKDMLAFIDKHGIKPIIEKSFPLAQAREALLFLENEHKFGKVVVTV